MDGSFKSCPPRHISSAYDPQADVPRRRLVFTSKTAKYAPAFLIFGPCVLFLHASAPLFGSSCQASVRRFFQRLPDLSKGFLRLRHDMGATSRDQSASGGECVPCAALRGGCPRLTSAIISDEGSMDSTESAAFTMFLALNPVPTASSGTVLCRPPSAAAHMCFRRPFVLFA